MGRGYVGMTKIPAAAAGRYWAEADAALAEEGRAIHVERVLARLADAGQGPACRDISGHGWLEVDLPEERDRAEESCAPRRRSGAAGGLECAGSPAPLAREPGARPPAGAAELFAAAMIHRGPDGHGFWQSGPVGARAPAAGHHRPVAKPGGSR